MAETGYLRALVPI